MQSAIAQGMSEDQVLAAGVTSDYDARLADGCFMNPETYNRLLYRSLSR
jgi:hypothetical protein